jgi:hypothetical protein
MKTFKCSFGKGITCEVQITDTQPEKGKSHILKIEWTGNPSRKTLRKVERAYIGWMNSVNKQLADEWKISMMYVFQTFAGPIEIWGYSPGEPPKLVERVSR